VQHGINCRREESQISEPWDATIREKAPNPFHLIQREAVSFANLRTFVPYSPFGRSLFDHGFSLRRLVSARSPRHRGRPTVGFTIARIMVNVRKSRNEISASMIERGERKRTADDVSKAD
jgi:hypothetical protein